MKRSIAFLLSLVLLGMTLCGCAARSPLPDLSDARSVEIRVYSQQDQSYTDYLIKDRKVVRKICDFFSSLECKKVKITEPLEVTYEVRILYSTGTAIAQIGLVAGHNVMDYDGDLHKITGEENVNRYIASIVADATDENP